ncbi:MAG: type II secretion system F family protein [Candidatus Marinarcus sp.]|uniref:type II secretion system F family protein n=1 Tax=Candidatus Marinarcus sp. TaxID=3100987 RepID=UPI003B0047F3
MLSAYKIKYQEEGKIKSKILSYEEFEAEKAHLNILSVQKVKKRTFTWRQRVTTKEILHFFSELNIMLQANILFSDALNILYKNSHNETLQEIILVILKSVQNGKQLDLELSKYRSVLGSLPLAFFKIAQNNGNLKSAMNSLVLILENLQQSKELLFNALRYPMILLVSLFALILFCFYFIIPKFEYLFIQYETTLPLATKILLGLKDFLHHYFLFVLVGVVLTVFYCLNRYKHLYTFRYKIDKWMILKIPIVSKLLFFIAFQQFFLCVKILLEDKHKFQSALLHSKILINNCYLGEKLKIINQQIQSGKPILYAFENSFLFDDMTLRLISVGEQSNALDITINEIEKIYKKRLNDSFKTFTTYIEPTFFVLISAIVVWIMLAIFMPVWNLGETMNF